LVQVPPTSFWRCTRNPVSLFELSFQDTRADVPLLATTRFVGAAGILDTAATVSVRVADAVSPPLSVTVAVIVWVPALKVDVENEPPDPIVPLILEVQVKLPVRLPS